MFNILRNDSNRKELPRKCPMPLWIKDYNRTIFSRKSWSGIFDDSTIFNSNSWIQLSVSDSFRSRKWLLVEKSHSRLWWITLKNKEGLPQKHFLSQNILELPVHKELRHQDTSNVYATMIAQIHSRACAKQTLQDQTSHSIDWLSVYTNPIQLTPLSALFRKYEEKMNLRRTISQRRTWQRSRQNNHLLMNWPHQKYHRGVILAWWNYNDGSIYNVHIFLHTYQFQFKGKMVPNNKIHVCGQPYVKHKLSLSASMFICLYFAPVI